MAHVITFYCDDHDEILTNLINQGYAPMMATSKKSPDYFKTFVGSFRFWSFEENDWTTDYNLVDISISEPEDISHETDWEGIAEWLSGQSNVLPLLKPVKLQSLETCDTYMEKRIDDKNKDKYFYSEQVKDGKFFAEIIKPLTDRPYTVVIKNWTPNQMIYMFSSICSVPSFGVLYPHDRNFIVSLWDWKKMGGDFNLNDLAALHLKQFEAGLIHKPLVYRESIGDVMNRYEGWGIGNKRKPNR